MCGRRRQSYGQADPIFLAARHGNVVAMKAITYTRYGSPDVLRVTEVDRPTPGSRDLLIRVVATTVTSAECGMRRGEPRWGRVILGFTGPRRRMRILGTEIAGIVEMVGRDVTRFRPGDRVFGFTGFSLGANAEFAVMPENGSLALKPPNISFETAAAVVDGATTALYFLRDKAKVVPGQSVLVNGASGSIGTYAVQLAKILGAQVTGVCGPANIDLVSSLGADRVIDYTTRDFTEGGDTYDVIFDTVGTSSFRRCKAALTARGCYVPTTGLPNTALMLWTALTRGPRVVTGMSVKKNAALEFLVELIEANKLTIVIDRTYPLDQIADAHRFVETGHKRGSVVVQVSPPDEL